MLFLLGKGVAAEGSKGMGIWGCFCILWVCIGRGTLCMASPLGRNLPPLDMDFGEEAFVRGYGREGVSGYPSFALHVNIWAYITP